MKPVTIIRQLAQTEYGQRFILYNDRLKNGDRSIKIHVWYDWTRFNNSSGIDINSIGEQQQDYGLFLERCVFELRRLGFGAKLVNQRIRVAV